MTMADQDDNQSESDQLSQSLRLAHKRRQFTFSQIQRNLLLTEFQNNRFPNRKELRRITNQLGAPETSVKNWFNSRRQVLRRAQRKAVPSLIPLMIDTDKLSASNTAASPKQPTDVEPVSSHAEIWLETTSSIAEPFYIDLSLEGVSDFTLAEGSTTEFTGTACNSSPVRDVFSNLFSQKPLHDFHGDREEMDVINLILGSGGTCSYPV